MESKKSVEQIKLTEKEEEIFKILIDVAEANNLNHVSLRVVGGWVRDKVRVSNRICCRYWAGSLMTLIFV